MATPALIVLAAIFWPFWQLPFWLLRYGVWGPGPGGKRVLAFLGGAILNPFLLVVVLAMSLRRRVTSWRPEWPAEFPGVRPGRVPAQLGRDNTRRNPQRTASTAAALMIGLALVTLVAVLGQGIRSTFTDAVDEIFVADYAITAQNNFSPIPIDAAQSAANTPGAEDVASVRTGEALVFGEASFVTAVTPNAGASINLDWKDGSQAVFAELGADGAFVDEDFADDHNLTVGSPISITTPTGKKLDLTVKGIFDPPAGGSPFGNVTFSSETFDANYDQPQNLYSFVDMDGGVTAANTTALEASLEEFPNAKAQTRDEFKDNQVSFLNNILNVLYVLLALSVVVSLFGIVNTLVLTVFERTRELGMLRAIGMTRRQVRRMIRYESVITALIGAVLGIVLGIRPRRPARLARRLHRLRGAGRTGDRVRDRRGDRRHHRRDLPCTAGRSAQPAPGPPVRVAGNNEGRGIVPAPLMPACPGCSRAGRSRRSRLPGWTAGRGCRSGR